MRWVILLGAGLFLVTGCKRSHPSPMAEMAAASAEHREMSPPIPVLSVADLKRSESYFRDTLGFRLEWEYGEPPDFASVSRGDARFFLCQRCPGKQSWTMVFTRDVDQLHHEIRGKGALVRRPPTDMPWNLREMLVADRDGNVIRFGSPVRK